MLKPSQDICTEWLFLHFSLTPKKTSIKRRIISSIEFLNSSIYPLPCRVMEMALVHDLAEAIVGDITPHCGVPVAEKHRREDEAMVEISKLLGNKGPETLKLFREYESRDSPEAKFVKDLDRLDLIMQAYEYEKRDQTHGKLEEFFAASTEHISHPLLKKIANEILTRRAELTPPTVEH
ncbi:5'-deoxynucleotidase HDDC2 isoform X2 [Diachasmimorpha longicaudata]|uniref:5'-deoxynucleotidase HDDC2 isoform X2 n=1 Tax=Diachasmimorpha longicaudata TaxID=58733 RepID=UPI0030B909B6